MTQAGGRVAASACPSTSAPRGELLHQVPSAPEGGERESAADHLAEAGEVRSHAVATLRTPPPDTEARDDLVEDEQAVGAAGLLPQHLEEAGCRRDDPHVAGHRLDDDGGQLARARAQKVAHSGHVVELCGPRERRDARRYTRAVRDTEGERARAGANEQRVDVSVIAACELQDRLAAGGRTRQTERAHRRLGSRVHQTNLLDGRERPDEVLGQLDLAAGGRSEAGPHLRLLRDGRAHAWRRVAENECAPRPEEIEIGPPVRVDHLRGPTTLEKERLPPDRLPRPHRAVHATRDDATRVRIKTLRLVCHVRRT